MRKKIAVIGSTGAQGGGLCAALIARHEEFAVRALTRDPRGDKAQVLATKGAEVVAADLDDLQSLVAAFTGVSGVFAVTNYWELHSAEREKQQAKNIADACRLAGVEHVVWSTLEDTRDYIPHDFHGMPMLDDVYRVPHLDGKNEANAYFKDLPTTYLITSFFWDNMITFGMAPRRGDDGVYRWMMPLGDAKLAGHAACDIGKAAASVFAQPDRFIGETIGIQADALTIGHMAEVVSKVLDVPVEYLAVDADTFRSLPFDGAEEIGNNFQYFRDCNASFLGLRSQSLMQELNPAVMGFEAFVRAHAEQILSVMVLDTLENSQS